MPYTRILFFIPFMLPILFLNPIYTNYDQQLIDALWVGNVRKAEHALINKATIYLKDETGWSLLHRAATQNHVTMVKLLLAYSVPVNTQDQEGNTPLHLATQRGNKEILTLLCTAGANPFIKNNQKKTALELAYSKQKADVTTLLEEYSAAITYGLGALEDKNNTTSLPILPKDIRKSIARYIFSS